jgi:hypothetical protein
MNENNIYHVYSSMHILNEKYKKIFVDLGFELSNAFNFDDGVSKTLHPESKLEINSLDDLINFSKNFNCELIIDFKNKTIEVYNDYRE